MYATNFIFILFFHILMYVLGRQLLYLKVTVRSTIA